jgi:hypothetical protein
MLNTRKKHLQTKTKKSIGNPTKERDVVEDVGYEGGREAPGLKVVEEKAEEVEEQADQRHRHGAQHRRHQAHALKNSVTRFSTSGFFHESVSPKPLSIPLGPFQIFFKNFQICNFSAGGAP